MLMSHQYEASRSRHLEQFCHGCVLTFVDGFTSLLLYVLSECEELVHGFEGAEFVTMRM